MNNHTQTIKLRILYLENQQIENILKLKEDVHQIFGQISTNSNLGNTIDLKDNSFESIGQTIIDDVIGIATGFISKKIMFATSHNPIKKLIGSFFQFAIAKYVSNHSTKIHVIGEVLVNKFLLSQDDIKEGIIE